jgi:hypothetical protein
MTDKELIILEKKSLHFIEFSPNTKTTIVSADLNKLLLKIRQSISVKKTVIAAVIDVSDLK